MIWEWNKIKKRWRRTSNKQTKTGNKGHQTDRKTNPINRQKAKGEKNSQLESTRKTQLGIQKIEI